MEEWRFFMESTRLPLGSREIVLAVCTGKRGCMRATIFAVGRWTERGH